MRERYDIVAEAERIAKQEEIKRLRRELFTLAREMHRYLRDCRKNLLSLDPWRQRIEMYATADCLVETTKLTKKMLQAKIDEIHQLSEELV